MKLLSLGIMSSVMLIGLFSMHWEKEKSGASTRHHLSYEADIQPLFVEKCGKCHDSDPSGDLKVITYEGLMAGGEHGKVIVPGKAQESSLYLKLTSNPPFGKQMPKKGDKLTDEQLKLVADWIDEGAVKSIDATGVNVSMGTEQTIQQEILFSTHIRPLLTAKCGQCHETDPSADLKLTNYEGVMSGGEHGKVVKAGSAQESNLYLKCTTSPPFGKQMPKKGDKLTAEELELLAKWIDGGAKE